MNRFIVSLIALVLSCQLAHSQQNSTVVFAPHERLSLDNGWRFYLGDIAFPIITGQSMSYSSAKAGKSWGAAAPEYDDTKWRQLNVPHDWAVESAYDSTENPTQGYRKRGIGWYRRNFKLNTSDKGKHIELQFDGVATNCTVWVNGTIMHRNFCGYTSFYIDITAMAKYGEDLNNIAIRVDAVTQEGWWYEGAGIYRHTWLVKQSPVHFITDGVFAQAIKKDNKWMIPVEATVENSGKSDANYTVETALLNDNGGVIVSGKTTGSLHPLAHDAGKINLSVSNPQLWTLENPTMYKVRTILSQDGKATDTLFTSCGFRTIQFRADSGFFLNDKWVKIKGVCNHQDHAGVGVAVPDAIWDFRLKKLKEMGVNANRCSHNPPSNEFLDACDRNGILVMDENRNFNISPEYQRQLEWMVRRDRNHPSIILWTVFNEEPMQGTENGYEMVRRMSNVVKLFDTSRPVTAAQSGGQLSPINVSQAVDVVGFNYQQKAYEPFHKLYPNKPITSSEDVSGLMTRGEYIDDRKHRQVLASYDDNKPGWGNTHRASWKAIAEKPYIAGCFIWTGFDYRGEPQPFEWPSASSSFGCMDVCGFPKTAFYIHQAQWLPASKPVLQLVPHWNWSKDSIGKNIRVMAMSNAETIKLKLNGKLIGEQKVDYYEMNTFQVPYQPGKLEAFGYIGGKEVSHFVVETTGDPVSLELIPDRTSLAGDGSDAIPVTVRALDAKGRPVETANLPIEFEISGPGNIIGMGNGNHNNHDPEKGNKYSLYNGLAQVILQSKTASSGQLVLTAKSGNLKVATISLNVKESAQIPAVSVPSPSLVLDKWKISPFYSSKPDPNMEVASYDMNTWAPTKPGVLQQFTGGNYALYRTTFKPFAEQCEKGGVIIFKGITGRTEVWLDKQLIGTKENKENGDFKVNIPAGQNTRTLTLLIEAENNRGGLAGVVKVSAL